MQFPTEQPRYQILSCQSIVMGCSLYNMIKRQTATKTRKTSILFQQPKIALALFTYNIALQQLLDTATVVTTEEMSMSN